MLPRPQGFDMIQKQYRQQNVNVGVTYPDMRKVSSHSLFLIQTFGYRLKGKAGNRAVIIVIKCRFN